MWIVIGIVAAVIVFAIVAALVQAKNTVVAPCPACGKQVGVNQFGTCEHCMEPLRSVAGKVEAVPAGFVADATVFQTSLAALRHPTQWEAVWGGRCCVCGGSGTRTRALKVKSVEGHYGAVLAPTNLMQTTKVDLGYCDAHSDGVRYWNAPHFANSIDNTKCWVAFRSADFYRAFMKANSPTRSAVGVPAPGAPAERWPCGHEKALGTTRCWSCST
jgi:hypothetical protein